MVISIDLEEKQYWLLLHRLPKFGPAKFKHLLQTSAQLSDWFDGYKPKKSLLRLLEKWQISPQFDWKGVDIDLKFEAQPNHHIVCLFDEAYPCMLKNIANPPAVLFIIGNLQNLKTYQIAMVGSRHPTPLGQEHAFDFARELALAGLTVTSGLALGIDGKCHQGALSVGGKTIAVLGQGLPNIYPKRHTRLSADIVEQDGTLVSEYATNSPILPQNFPRRNRIVSGLSLGVFVVEATIHSGSLISASFALEQGREVFALPGSIHNPLSKGCHHLIRQGAKCIESINHILEEIRYIIPSQVSVSSDLDFAKKSVTKKEALSSQLKKILSHIGYECTPIDRVVKRTGLSSEKISPLLSELELHGWVTLVSGGYIRI